MRHLNIKPYIKLVKQQLRRFHPDIMKTIEAEVHKLIECGFIQKEHHSNWVANSVLVLKKNEKIWICIDYHDLNTACPKDKFHYPSLMS